MSSPHTQLAAETELQNAMDQVTHVHNINRIGVGRGGAFAPDSRLSAMV